MLLIFLLLLQDPSPMAPEQINAVIFPASGREVDVVDIKIKGIEPYTFEFHTENETTLISLFRVARLSRLEERGRFEILLDSGDILEGRINSLAFTATPATDQARTEIYNLHHLQRIHFLSSNQLRACVRGHYERYTPYPYCPVCGLELLIGPYPEEPPDEEKVQAPTHRLRLDPRDPTPTTRTGRQ